jgi:hypothetical protein
VLKNPTPRNDEDVGAQHECDCPCHRGSVILHVVACCEGFMSNKSKPKQATVDVPADNPEGTMQRFTEGLQRVLRSKRRSAPAASAKVTKRKR